MGSRLFRMKINLLLVDALKSLLVRKAVLAALGLMAFGLLAVRAPAAEDGGAGTAQPAKSAILDRIQDHYQHTMSFTAKFTDEITGMGGTKRKRTGRLFYKRPGRMRWEFDPPQTETVVANGHKLYDYQPDLNQVIELPIERAFKSAAPLAFLLGMGDIRRDFNTSLLAPDTVRFSAAGAAGSQDRRGPDRNGPGPIDLRPDGGAGHRRDGKYNFDPLQHRSHQCPIG